MVLCLLTALCAAIPAQADTRVVTNNDDSGAGSLRQAIADAAAGDTITFDAGLAGQTITLTSGQLVIDKDLAIVGPGASQLTISGNHASRVFLVTTNGATTTTASIQDVTISDGYAVADPDSLGLVFGGGGIYNNFGSLTVSHCTLLGNTAVGLGGGIASEGVLSVLNSTVSGNSATTNATTDIFGGGGGGIAAVAFGDSGSVIISNCVVSGNSCYGGAGGGGIFADGFVIVSSIVSSNTSDGFFGGGGILSGSGTVSNCTVSGNSATTSNSSFTFFGGGGITSFSRSALTISGSMLSGNSALLGGGVFSYSIDTLTILNSTLSGNSAALGGGIFFSGGSLAISYSTLWLNSASFSDDEWGIVESDGAAIYSANHPDPEFATQVSIKNSIIGNSPLGNSDFYNGGTNPFSVAGVNFDTDGSCPGFNHVAVDDLKLGPLADNGGPTLTHALLPDSIAINAATDCTDWFSTAVTKDQRGVARPQGPACDVGAFEVQVNTCDTPLVTITGPAIGSVLAANTAVTFTGSFSGGNGPFTAQWIMDGNVVAGVVDQSAKTVTATVTFAGAGVYQVQLSVANACGNSGTADTVNALQAIVVIYDPSAGFVTGGGWINSPAGAAVWDATLTGKANFGFVSRYKKGQTVPTGETEFVFKAGNLKFNSTSYDWLVVSGARAQYKGAGTVNGVVGYSFMLTAIDGQISGGGVTDKFRIKIWNTATSAIVYDNQMGALDSATPSTVIGGGSIVIQK